MLVSRYVFLFLYLSVLCFINQSYKYEKHSREICRSRCPLRRVPHLGFKTFFWAFLYLFFSFNVLVCLCCVFANILCFLVFVLCKRGKARVVSGEQVHKVPKVHWGWNHFTFISLSLSVWHHLEKSKKCNKNYQIARILNLELKMQIVCVPKALKKGVSGRT